ncbi:MAG TPA: ESPR-type extended signal peptide-containing protein, partial [Acetobacteraceae bacterium]|nr:ESPR-type extended signal peptide-containing protein [Acetobacteraceae bacterium]
MNRIYRRAWNRSLRQPQVASELARSPHDGRVGVAAAPRIPRHRPLAWACAVALGVAGMLPLSAWAAQGASTGGSGGVGGGSYAGSGGAGNGTGGQGGAGSLGSAGSGGNGGDGGHGGSVISAG